MLNPAIKVWHNLEILTSENFPGGIEKRWRCNSSEALYLPTGSWSRTSGDILPL
jgi:hypothetical protein